MTRKASLSCLAGAACLCACGTAGAGDITLGFFSDTGDGSVTAFPWDGGDASGFGTAGTLRAAMNYAAAQGGGTNFSGAGFLNSEVNVYLVDFSADASGTFNDAGLTAFIMWGTGNGIGGGDGSFQAEVDVSPSVDEGDDGIFTAGLSEIFALGSGVTIEVGGLTVDVDVSHNERPVGYAITNLFDYPDGRLNQAFTLAGDIRTLGLYGFGEGKVWNGTDTNGNHEIFNDELTLTVPGPGAGAIMLGFMGIAGLVPRRRRAE